MKHKHAEVLIAIAEGRAVEYKKSNSEKWSDLNQWLNPIDNGYLDWRVTPAPRPQWQQNLIDAAKAGKVVEFYDGFSWGEANLNKQLDLYNFGYATQSDFRIRPTKVTRYLWAIKDFAGDWCTTDVFRTEREAAVSYTALEYIKLDYTATEFEE